MIRCPNCRETRCERIHTDAFDSALDVFECQECGLEFTRHSHRHAHPDALVNDIAIPLDWIDVSSPNDAAPCWRIAESGLCCFIHSSDKNTREAGCEESPRFSVFVEDEGGSLFDSDDWDVTLTFVKAYRMEKKCDTLVQELLNRGMTIEEINELVQKI